MNTLDRITRQNEADLHDSAVDLVRRVRDLRAHEREMRTIRELATEAIRRAFGSNQIVPEEVSRLRGIASEIDTMLGAELESIEGSAVAARLSAG